MRDLALEREIRQYLDTLRMVNTHEHLDTEEDFCSAPVDFGRLFLHYANCDVVSAGCPAADMTRIQSDPCLSPTEKWALMAPYWEAMKDTGYGRCLEIAIRDLYGLDGLSAATVEPLSQRMNANRRPGFYREVFDKAGVGVALWNRLDRYAPRPPMWLPDYDRTLFVQDLLCPPMPGQGGWERDILCLDDYLEAVEERFVAHAKQASAVKFGLAYERPLVFENRARGEIEPLVNRALNAAPHRNISALTLAEGRAVQDYVVHFLLRLCSEHGVTVKFHTGLQEGNGNTITNSRAALLSNLFFQYPKVKFDIYHISYPYEGELATLAKNFPNVAIDFCWMWIINPAAGRRALSEFLDAVPATKIHGFGGDFIFIEGTYGHAVMAKENIARVLADKVRDGELSMARALKIGKWLLRDNPIAWFGLHDKVPPEVLGE
jgi:hypothetical protein